MSPAGQKEHVRKYCINPSLSFIATSSPVAQKVMVFVKLHVSVIKVLWYPNPFNFHNVI